MLGNRINYQVMELNKQLVETSVTEGAPSLQSLLEYYSSQGSALIFILKNIGRLPATFDYYVFVPYLRNSNDTIRFWAAKNIGKSKSFEFFDILKNHATNEKSSVVLREIVSSIGRTKNPEIIPFLIDMTNNNDPKIVAQAIRGLLSFKGNPLVDKRLSAMINHENEVISSVVKKEYFEETNKSKVKKQAHAETYDFLKNVVVHADVRQALKFVKDESIHLTFTSPPYYNARDYSIYPSYDAYLDFLREVFEETYRITKEGRFLIVNTSPVIVPRISRAHSSKRYPIPFDLHGILVKMGWEFIDDIVWMKPEYSVKNRIGGFQQHKKPLAYKPNSVTEYLMVYRKKTDKLLDWNIKQYPDNVVEDSKVKGKFETTNVWRICPKSDKIHSAVFPEELCERVVKYYSYVGDLVFDPFAGSGTFGRAAKKLNRYFFLTEQAEEYFNYMKNTEISLNGDCCKTKFLTLDEFKETTL